MKIISKMNKKRFTINITAGIAVMLLLIGVITGATTILLNAAYAQTATTLREPYFVEKGKLTGQKEIGPNRTQYTFTTNGTMNGNIEVTNTGEFVSVSKGNNLAFDQGKGVIATKDGSETANYTFIDVENDTQGGKTIFQGASAYSTNSTGKLPFLNNMLGIFKGETDQNGNIVNTEWQWK
jgi:hypothetical protein